MKFSFETVTDVAPERIWLYYADVKKWFDWEDDLEDIVLDGEFATGTRGRMTLQGQPPLAFDLVEVTPNRSFCDKTEVPGLGTLYFNHELLAVDSQTTVRHSVAFESASQTDSKGHLGFLAQVFADVPDSIFKLIEAAR